MLHSSQNLLIKSVIANSSCSSNRITLCNGNKVDNIGDGKFICGNDPNTENYHSWYVCKNGELINISKGGLTCSCNYNKNSTENVRNSILPGGASSIAFNNKTLNKCGEECGHYKGLCDTGMTCAFYNNDCYSLPYGYPYVEAVCVPNSAMNTRVKQHDCPPDRGGSAQPRITKLDGSPWTPNQNNINELCNPNSPIPTNTITATLTPTPTNQPPKQDVCGPVDVNNDSRIDIIDFSAFARKFNSICR